MTTDAEKRAIALLETIGGEVAELRGENRAAHVAIDRRFDALDADVEVVRVSQQQHGQRLAGLPCEAHARDIARHAQRISEAVRRVTCAEQTGRIELTKGEARRDVLRSISRIALGVFAVLGVIWPIVWAIYNR